MPSREESRLFVSHSGRLPTQNGLSLLPCLMSVCLAILFAWSAPFAATLRDDNYTLAAKLGIDAPHEFGPLVFMLWIFTALQSVSAIGIVVLLCIL